MTGKKIVLGSLIRRAARIFFFSGALLLTAALGSINLRLYVPTTDQYGTNGLGADVRPQLKFLREALDRGEGERMQGLFPEGYFFTHALYGLTWTQVGDRASSDSELRREAIREAQWALQRLDTETGREPFNPGLSPPYGIFYAGWRGWLEGSILKLQAPADRDPRQVERYEANCTAMARAFEESSTPFLESYPEQCWPCDSVVAVAALCRHDAILPPRFENVIKRWEEEAKRRVDPFTGLLPHQVHPVSGLVAQTARGSSQSVIATFLPQIDPIWARQQYKIFRGKFVGQVMGIPGIREYPPGIRGKGDVDSGPLIAGISASSTVVTIAAALTQGDRPLADPLLHGAEAAGFPFSWGGEKRYGLGMLPAGDAFLVWSKTARPLFSGLGAQYPPVVTWTWRWPMHVVSAAALGLAWVPVILLRKKMPTAG